MGIGDWGLGIGDWPNPQSPIPNPQSPIPKSPINSNDNFKIFKIIKFLSDKLNKNKCHLLEVQVFQAH